MAKREGPPGRGPLSLRPTCLPHKACANAAGATHYTPWAVVAARIGVCCRSEVPSPQIGAKTPEIFKIQPST